MCHTVAKTIKKRRPPPVGIIVRHGRDDRVAQERTAGGRAVVQGRIDQQCLIESGRALGGQKEAPFSRSSPGGRRSRATDPTAFTRATRGDQTS